MKNGKMVMTTYDPTSIEAFLATCGHWTFSLVERPDLQTETDKKFNAMPELECGLHPSGAKVWVGRTREQHYNFMADVPDFGSFWFIIQPLKDDELINTGRLEFNFMLAPECEIFIAFRSGPNFLRFCQLDQGRKNYILSLVLSFARDFHKSTPSIEAWLNGGSKIRASRTGQQLPPDVLHEQMIQNPLYKWRLIKIERVRFCKIQVKDFGTKSTFYTLTGEDNG